MFRVIQSKTMFRVGLIAFLISALLRIPTRIRP